MLPMRLNLLPPDKQHNLQRTIVAQFIKNIFELAFFVICLIAIGLLGGQWTLQNYFHEITVSTISVADGPHDRTIRINRINTILRNAEASQKGYVLWTPVLTTIHESIPDNIVLTKMVIGTDKKELTLIGRAATRDDLLELKRSLEALPFLGVIDIPLSQLTKKENIPFSFSPSFSL